MADLAARSKELALLAMYLYRQYVEKWRTPSCLIWWPTTDSLLLIYNAVDLLSIYYQANLLSIYYWSTFDLLLIYCHYHHASYVWKKNLQHMAKIITPTSNQQPTFTNRTDHVKDYLIFTPISVNNSLWTRSITSTMNQTQVQVNENNTNKLYSAMGFSRGGGVWFWGVYVVSNTA